MPRYVTYGFVGLAVVLAGVSVYGTFRGERVMPATAEFGGVSLRLDYATTTATRELGLGGRESVPDNYGMLFVFDTSDYYGFWMKDMQVPIDMYWLDSKGQVVHIETAIATTTYPHVFYPSRPAQYVLETRAGFGTAHGIAIGTKLVLKNIPTVSK